MKTTTLIKSALFLCFCLLLSACNKDISSLVKNRAAPQPIQIDAAKGWREQHLASRPGQKILKPQWDDAWSVTTNSKERMLVVPAPNPRIDNPDEQLLRFFFFTLKENTIVNGRIVEVLGHKYNLKENIDMLLKNYDSDVIYSFNGAFLFYDINYHNIESRTFKEGKIQSNMTTRISTMSVEEVKKMMADPNVVKKNSHQ